MKVLVLIGLFCLRSSASAANATVKGSTLLEQLLLGGFSVSGVANILTKAGTDWCKNTSSTTFATDILNVVSSNYNPSSQPSMDFAKFSSCLNSASSNFTYYLGKLSSAWLANATLDSFWDTYTAIVEKGWKKGTSCTKVAASLIAQAAKNFKQKIVIQAIQVAKAASSSGEWTCTKTYGANYVSFNNYTKYT